MWGGAEGGLGTIPVAALLAAHGYPALALAYFGAPGLPPTLNRVPLEYFAAAVRYLDRQPSVDPARVGVWGISRGSEAAQLTGIHFPDLVHAVMAGVPSSVVNASVHDGNAPAWTLGGAVIPHALTTELGSTTPHEADASIAVERIVGPVLLECATHDRIWPSCQYSGALQTRLAAHPTRWKPTVLQLTGAGHYAATPAPWFPYNQDVSAGNVNAGGGTAVSDGAARVLAWPTLLSFVASIP